MTRMLAVIVAVSVVAAAAPDFSGRWRLVGQETSAFRGQSAVGNYEGLITVRQSADRLSVATDEAIPGGQFEYALTGMPLTSQVPNGESTVTVSRWEGSTLVTKGRRVFAGPDGPRVYGFVENRRLSDGRRRMTVETVIDMFPRDLKRTSTYERVTPLPVRIR
jgi:hypothetical protein